MSTQNDGGRLPLATDDAVRLWEAIEEYADTRVQRVLASSFAPRPFGEVEAAQTRVLDLIYGKHADSAQAAMSFDELEPVEDVNEEARRRVG